MRLLLAGLFVCAGLLLVVILLGEAGALDQRVPGVVAFPVAFGVLAVITLLAVLLFAPRSAEARRRKLLAAALRVVEGGGELAPPASLEHSLAFVRTHRDLLDAHEALRREASGMRPWVRGLVILMGVAWVTCAVCVVAFGEVGRRATVVWLAVGGIILWYFVVVPLRRRRALLRGNAPRAEVALRTSARELLFELEGVGEVKRWWRDLDLFLATDKGLVLGFADGMVQWLPTRAFGGGGERERFVRDVEERMAQEEVRRGLPAAEHPILAEPWTYRITELRYWKDGQGACLDVTLRRGVETRRLRFLRPVNVWFPGEDLLGLASGIAIFSEPQAELDGLRVLVTGRDEEPGVLNLLAEDVVDLDAPEGVRVDPRAEPPSSGTR